MKNYLSILFVFLFASGAFSQEKLEREYRIRTSEVPAGALRFVAESFGDMRVKWYGEENLRGKSIEAKGKHGGQQYSIEFDSAGKLQDIEVLISFRNIPGNVRSAIEQNLQSRFDKYRIQKTQQQWSGSEDVLKALVRGQQEPGSFTTNYEITLRGTKDKRGDYFEILANDKGEILRESRIVFRNNQHLIF